MKKVFLFLFILVTICSSAQNSSTYKKVYRYGELHKDWALVKTIAGTYGFINRDGKEILPAIYAKIYKFNENAKNLAMVKSVADTYGFINIEGKEVINPIYYKKEEAIQRLTTQL